MQHVILTMSAINQSIVHPSKIRFTRKKTDKKLFMKFFQKFQDRFFLGKQRFCREDQSCSRDFCNTMKHECDESKHVSNPKKLGLHPEAKGCAFARAFLERKESREKRFQVKMSGMRTRREKIRMENEVRNRRKLRINN